MLCKTAYIISSFTLSNFSFIAVTDSVTLCSSSMLSGIWTVWTIPVLPRTAG